MWVTNSNCVILNNNIISTFILFYKINVVTNSNCVILNNNIMDVINNIIISLYIISSFIF